MVGKISFVRIDVREQLSGGGVLWLLDGYSTGEGDKARERSDQSGGGGGRGVSPSHGRESFEN